MGRSCGLSWFSGMSGLGVDVDPESAFWSLRGPRRTSTAEPGSVLELDMSGGRYQASRMRSTNMLRVIPGEVPPFGVERPVTLVRVLRSRGP